MRLSAAVLGGYESPRALFNYTKLAMPHAAPGSLTDEEYWDVVAYLIDARDLATLDVPLRDATADSIAWP